MAHSIPWGAQNHPKLGGETDENNNPAFLHPPPESTKYFSIHRRGQQSNFQNSHLPFNPSIMAPYQKPKVFSSAQQFIVMPAMFSAGPSPYRPKFRVRRCCHQNNNCRPNPCGCPQNNNQSLLCQGKKFDNPTSDCRSKNNNCEVELNPEEITRSVATSCGRKRIMSTPVKDPSPAACCFCLCQIPYIPPTTPQDCIKTGATPYNHPSCRTADENVQSFTPIKSASTSSTAVKKGGGGSSVFFAPQPPSQFQPNDGGRPLGLVKSKSDPFLQVSYELDEATQIVPGENVENTVVMTGTRGKFTNEQLQQQRHKNIEVEQIYPKTVAVKKPMMADQATSYSGQKIDIEASFQMGPPSTIPPFSEATTVYSFPATSASPQTGSSPSPSRKSAHKLQSSLKSSKNTSTVSQKSVGKSTRFKSIVPRDSDESEEVPLSKQGSYRRPTAFVSSTSGTKRQGRTIPEQQNTMQQHHLKSTTANNDHQPPAASNAHSNSRQQSNKFTTANLQHDAVSQQTGKSLTSVPQTSQQLSTTAAPSDYPSFVPHQNSKLCVTESGKVGRKLSYETVCRPANESFYGGPYEDPVPFGGRKVNSGNFDPNSATDPNANLPPQTRTENLNDPNSGRPASLPPKSEPKPPLPPKPTQRIPTIPTHSRFPGGWHKGRGGGSGHVRKKRSVKKKDSDGHNCDSRSPSASKAHDTCGGGQQQNSMFPFGCLPLGPMIMPQINARDGTVTLPSALKCQKVCFAPGSQIATTMKSCLKNTKHSTLTPMTFGPMPMNNPGLPPGLSPICVCPNFQTNPAGQTGNMAAGQALNGLMNGQSAGPKPVITIIPGMVYAPPGAANQVEYK